MCARSPMAEVAEIYRGQYWDAIRGDDLPAGVAYCVFDAAVNSGPGRALRWLQAEIGATVDGVIGNETLGLAARRDPVRLIDGYCARRLTFMKRLKPLAHVPKRLVAPRGRGAGAVHGVGCARRDPQPSTVACTGQGRGGRARKRHPARYAYRRKGRGAVTGILGSTGTLLSGRARSNMRLRRCW